jgi:hypothetical protein
MSGNDKGYVSPDAGLIVKSPVHQHEEKSEDGISLKESTDQTDFVPSKGLTSQQAEELLRKYGKNELEDKKTPKVRYS